MTRKDVKWEWGTKEQEAFDTKKLNDKGPSIGTSGSKETILLGNRCLRSGHRIRKMDTSSAKQLLTNWGQIETNRELRVIIYPPTSFESIKIMVFT
jgi:hypothetical protein